MNQSKVVRSDPALYQHMIGQKVWKNPKTTSKVESKPFKSGRKVNTVKAIMDHPYTGGIGFTFEEDDSIVECFRCSIAPARHLGELC